MADANEPQWYAVYTKPRAEKKLREHLARHAIEHYLPLVRRRKKWSDRYKWVEEPVFSSYVFVKIAASERLRVLRLPHAVYIVSRDNAPLPIAEETITLLRIAVDRFAETLTVRSSNDIASGERVRVIAGPFAGHEATVLSRRGKAYVVVNFAALEQAVEVEIPVSNLERIPAESLTPS